MYFPKFCRLKNLMNMATLHDSNNKKGTVKLYRHTPVIYNELQKLWSEIIV